MNQDLMPDGEVMPAALAIREAKPQPTHPVAAYIASLEAASSRDAMKRTLEHIAALMSSGNQTARDYPWHELRWEHLNALKALLLKTDNFRTVNRKLSAVKGVLRAAWRVGLISAEELHRAVDVKGAKGETVPKGRSLHAGEMHALLNECAADREANPAAAARDAAILAVMYSIAGPRRCEVVALDLSDYDAQTGRVLIRGGKGNKERTDYLDAPQQAALDAWIAVRGDEPGALFCAIHKSGKVLPGRMTAQSVWGVIEKRSTRAGVKTFTPHDVRRTVAGDLIDRGEDIVTVQQLLGHSSPTVTSQYDRRPEGRKARAAKLLHFPYAAAE